MSETSSTQKLTDQIDIVSFCDITINDIPIERKNIRYLFLKSSIFDIVPRIELQFSDNGKFAYVFPIQDRSEIKVKISSSNKDDNFLVDAVFESTGQIINELQGGIKIFLISVVGHLKCGSFLDKVKTRSFSSKKSSEVISSIASENNFKTDIRVSTNDNMTWLQLNVPDATMVQHCVDRSFKDDTDPVFAFSDFNSFVMTSLKEQQKKTPKIKMRDLKFEIEEAKDDSEIKENAGDFLNYANLERFDFSTLMNKSGSYKTTFSYFDLTENKEETFQSSNVIEGKPLKNKLYKDDISLNETFGIKTNNTHSKYFLSKIINKIGKMTDFSSFLNVTINLKSQAREVLENKDKKLSLFDIIDVKMPILDGKDDNRTYSGKYVVGSISYVISLNKPPVMNLALFKNSMNVEQISSGEVKILI